MPDFAYMQNPDFRVTTAVTTRFLFKGWVSTAGLKTFLTPVPIACKLIVVMGGEKWGGPT